MVNILRIGFDIDNTLIPTTEDCLKKYNEKHNTSFKFEDIKTYDFQGMDIDVKELYSFADEEFFEAVEPYPDAIDFVNMIMDLNNTCLTKIEIYFVTSGSSETMPFRKQMLKRFFNWFEDDMLIKLTNKQLLHIDILFDDYIDNLTDAPYSSGLYSQPYNKQLTHLPSTDIERVNNWKECCDKVKQIQREVIGELDIVK